MPQINNIKISGDPRLLRSFFTKSALAIPFLFILPTLYLQSKSVWITSGMVGGCFCGFLALLLRESVRRFEEALAKIDDGEYLQKWQYTTTEWKNFSQQELQRRKKRSTHITKRTIAISCVSYIVSIFFFSQEKDFVAISLVIGIVTIFFIALTIFIVRYTENTWRKNNIDVVDKDTLTAFIAKSFVVFGKEYHNFEEPGISLLKTDIENNNLVFTIEIQAKQKAERKLTILIPQGQINSAKKIINTLSRSS
ncbi:hypothetical protein [Candidatus Uabimicrobium sp. HlEnr_7]|uniref:hypothetical protein n=1 Tax=Candidatus Uabimicrobium helgolandensis TaxID=3095367 RepID=UPI003555E329